MATETVSEPRADANETRPPAAERDDLLREAAYEVDALMDDLLARAVEPDWRVVRGIAWRVRKLSHAVMFLADPTVAEADMEASRRIVTATDQND